MLQKLPCSPPGLSVKALQPQQPQAPLNCFGASSEARWKPHVVAEGDRFLKLGAQKLPGHPKSGQGGKPGAWIARSVLCGCGDTAADPASKLGSNMR